MDLKNIPMATPKSLWKKCHELATRTTRPGSNVSLLFAPVPKGLHSKPPKFFNTSLAHSCLPVSLNSATARGGRVWGGAGRARGKAMFWEAVAPEVPTLLSAAADSRQLPSGFCPHLYWSPPPPPLTRTAAPRPWPRSGTSGVRRAALYRVTVDVDGLALIDKRGEGWMCSTFNAGGFVALLLKRMQLSPFLGVTGYSVKHNFCKMTYEKMTYNLPVHDD